MTDLTALAVRLVACARCEARPGQRCTTIPSGRTTQAHSARTRAVYAAWQVGYGEGLRDSLDSAERHQHRGNDLDGLIGDLRHRLA